MGEQRPANPDADIDRLAAAVAARFAASASTARLAGSGTGLSPAPTLIDRLASAVGQRLAARSGPTDIDRLAGAVADRLVASSSAAHLVSGASLSFEASQINRLASEVAHRLQ